MAVLRKKYSNLIFNIALIDDGQGVESLKLGKADLVVIPSADVGREFDSKKLKAERYLLVCPSSWRSRKLEDIVRTERIVDFNGEDRMTLNYLDLIGLTPIKKKERHLVNNTDALARAVELGLGYSVLYSEFAEPMINQEKLVAFLPKKYLEHSLTLAWYPRKFLPSYMKDFISALK